MPIIEFDGNRCECNPDETVLECLDRYNCPPPSSCQSGLCHTCMMRSVKGQPPASSQNGLKDSLIKQGYFLPCICKPETDMVVALPDEAAAPHASVKLIEKTLLTPAIARLRFSVDDDFSYIPGQYTNIFKDDETTRTYSIASVPALDDYLEFHVELIPNGKMSQWVFDTLKEGDELQVSEALGECFYQAGEPEANLLLIATGSGFAPIYGIVRDALNQGHTGEIHVYQGSGVPEKLYLVDEMKALAAKHSNLFYHPCLSRGEAEGFEHGRANELALAEHKDLKGWTIYLCGHPEMVQATKKKAFLAGASMHDIYSDPFEFAKS